MAPKKSSVPKRRKQLNTEQVCPILAPMKPKKLKNVNNLNMNMNMNNMNGSYLDDDNEPFILKKGYLNNNLSDDEFDYDNNNHHNNSYSYNNIHQDDEMVTRLLGVSEMQSNNNQNLDDSTLGIANINGKRTSTRISKPPKKLDMPTDFPRPKNGKKVGNNNTNESSSTYHNTNYNSNSAVTRSGRSVSFDRYKNNDMITSGLTPQIRELGLTSNQDDFSPGVFSPSRNSLLSNQKLLMSSSFKSQSKPRHCKSLSHLLILNCILIFDLFSTEYIYSIWYDSWL